MRVASSSASARASISWSATSTGPEEPVLILGCPVRLLYPLTTLTGFNSINVAATSIQDRLCYSVMANGQVIEDTGVLVGGSSVR